MTRGESTHRAECILLCAKPSEEHMNVREVPQAAAQSASLPSPASGGGKGGGYGVDPYLDWLKQEGLPLTEDYGVYLFDVPTAPWPRYGVNGAAVHLKGRG